MCLSIGSTYFYVFRSMLWVSSYRLYRFLTSFNAEVFYLTFFPPCTIVNGVFSSLSLYLLIGYFVFVNPIAFCLDISQGPVRRQKQHQLFYCFNRLFNINVVWYKGVKEVTEKPKVYQKKKLQKVAAASRAIQKGKRMELGNLGVWGRALWS